MFDYMILGIGSYIYKFIYVYAYMLMHNIWCSRASENLKYLFCETVAIIFIGSLDKLILNKHSFK